MSQATAVRARGVPPGAADRQGKRAGVVSRLAAMVIDAISVVAVIAVGYLAVAAVLFMRAPVRFRLPSPSYAELVAIAAIVATLILALSWSSTGRSPGMHLMGLRLLGPDGRRIHAVRSVLRAATCVAFPFGLLWSAVSRRNASLHDLVFGTSVVYDWHQHEPDEVGD